MDLKHCLIVDTDLNKDKIVNIKVFWIKIEDMSLFFILFFNIKFMSIRIFKCSHYDYKMLQPNFFYHFKATHVATSMVTPAP